MSYLQPVLTKKQRANAKKWIKALRSGKFEQGFGKLCHDGKYCCLGVAAEVCNVPVNLGHEELNDRDAREILGLIDGCGSGRGDEETLTQINDRVSQPFHRDFNGIADLLEESLAKCEVPE